jgi:hypothetical protein
VGSGSLKGTAGTPAELPLKFTFDNAFQENHENKKIREHVGVYSIGPSRRFWHV